MSTSHARDGLRRHSQWLFTQVHTGEYASRSTAERHWNVPTYCMRGHPPSGIGTCPHTACAVIRRVALERALHTACAVNRRVALQRAHIEHLRDFSTSMCRILGRSCLTDPCLLMRSAGRALAECEFRDPHRMRDEKGQCDDRQQASPHGGDACENAIAQATAELKRFPLHAVHMAYHMPSWRQCHRITFPSTRCGKFRVELKVVKSF